MNSKKEYIKKKKRSFESFRQTINKSEKFHVYSSEEEMEKATGGDYWIFEPCGYTITNGEAYLDFQRRHNLTGETVRLTCGKLRNLDSETK